MVFTSDSERAMKFDRHRAAPTLRYGPPWASLDHICLCLCASLSDLSFSSTFSEEIAMVELFFELIGTMAERIFSSSIL